MNNTNKSGELDGDELIAPNSSASRLFSEKSLFLVVLLAWTIAIYCVVRMHFDAGVDMASALLTAASLALFVFSIFIALLAIFGWQTVVSVVRDTAKTAASRAVSVAMKQAQAEIEKIKPMAEARIKLENELRGRTLTILGFIIGESSLNPETKSPDDERARENLAEAIHLCEQGYGYLKSVGGAAEYMGLNNLVFYSCAYGVSGDDCRVALVKQARELMEVGEEHAASNLLLTYSRTILEHGTDPKEKDRARSKLRELVAGGKLSGRESREASIYLGRFKERSGGPLNSALPAENADGQGL